MLIPFQKNHVLYTFNVKCCPSMKNFKINKTVLIATLIFVVAAALYFQYLVTLI